MEKKTALKILRERHAKALFSERTALEALIPELKESDDERIRREIIYYLCEREIIERPTETSIKKNWIAWLKKQGKTSWKPSKEEMEVLYGLSYITNEFDEQKEDVIIRLYQDLKREFFNGASFENMFPTNTSAEIEKQRNPAWSEEDEDMRQKLLFLMKEENSIDSWEGCYEWIQSLNKKNKQ